MVNIIKIKDRIEFNKADIVYKKLKKHFSDEQENFILFCLDSDSKLIYEEVMFKGSLNMNIIDIRLILKRAIFANSAGIIIAHNHPSGKLKASSEDIIVTKRLKKACDLFNITLYDHIIFSNEDYKSFIDEV
jgi:DNA repair protein RadC